jgi:hypothetical protein
MEAILFHPETSMRRALILTLGTYDIGRFSQGERELLISKLLDLYRDDPDSGIHGAAEWTLREWGQGQSLSLADAELRKLQDKDRGERRWYVNGQGQTFATIEGPVEFVMGSPPAEPDRGSDETPRRVAIPRRFAIASKEVTVEQFQPFVRANPAYYHVPEEALKKYTPDPGGPMIGITWHVAAAYCNWLSEQEGIPKDQWCYLPNREGQYDRGMTSLADVPRRTGYRLPTDAE